MLPKVRRMCQALPWSVGRHFAFSLPEVPTAPGQNRLVPRSLRTHVIMDLRGYSRVLLNGGEAHASVLMRAYERLVRGALKTKTFEIDHVADTFHLAFPTPAQAVLTTTAI